MTEQIPYLSRREVERLLTLDLAADSQRAAFEALGRGTAEQPFKLMHSSRFDDSTVFCTVARLSAGTGAIAKFGSVNPGNPAAGLPSVSALVTALDAGTGRPVAVLDGIAITTLRTAAASAVAVDALAAADAADLGVIGSGTQARAHVRALARVRPLTEVRLWSPTPANRERAARELADELGIGVRAVGDAEEAVTGMAIVAACSLSREPVVRGRWLKPGTTVVSVGSFEPDRAEVDAEVLRRAAAVVVDDPDTAAAHAGPVMRALRDGDLRRPDLIALGAVLTGRRAARTGPEDIVFYNSVGLGVQDAAATWALLDASARAEGAGR
ncbi:ornithine cyclodeaminase family protein [Spirillospora sp. NPDC050679]